MYLKLLQKYWVYTICG